MKLTPPLAKKQPIQLEKFGQVRVDDYYWLNDREDPEVIDYLKAENDYTEAVMAHTAPLQEKLFEEIKNRIKQTDQSVPYRMDDYFYYARYQDGHEYPVYCRKKGSLEAAEEVMIDANLLAEGEDFFSIGEWEISTGQNILAYTTDTVGRRIYAAYFKNLETGEMLSDVIPGVTGDMEWADDNRTLFYTRQDPQTLRSYQVFRHLLGTDPDQDVLVYQEDDETFSCYIAKSKSRKYLMIVSIQSVSAEFRLLEASDPGGEFRVFLPRERDHEYQVDHLGDKLYVRTNWNASNFRLMETAESQTAKENWKEVVPHRSDVLLEDFELFTDFLVVEERSKGLNQLRIRPWDGSEEHYLDFGEPAYQASTSDNYEADTDLLRFEYTSLTTPESTFDYNMRTREKTLLKQEEVLGGFDSSNYRTERLEATARDGVQVPISLVYRKDHEPDGTNALMIYAYGSYGFSMDASFMSSRLSLLDRGFTYAIAHVRGGEELGRQWYEDGKLLEKKNTFHDFVDCVEYLVKEGYGAPDKVFASGGSAGGLLMGVVVNLRPDLFRGVIAAVPFVDVVTTMLDPSVPLTTGEYDEWGDPNQKEYYDYMLSYSPYDNVEAKGYPNLLVTTGLHDSQVQYWEPAKWVAKLRALKTDNNRLLLKTNMDAGHGGVSGRYRRYREIAFQFAFLLDLLGIES